MIDVIREITMQDINEIYELNKNELGELSDLETVKDTLERVLALPDQHYMLGYELDNKLVGYVHAQHFEMLYNSYCFLNVVSVAVDNNYQGNGIGSSLIKALENVARDNNLDGVRINSGNNHERAHGFYGKQGYQSVREQKRFIKLFEESI